jgi:hypothetical protein
MKRVKVCSLTLAVMIGVAMTGTAGAQTASDSGSAKAKTHKTRTKHHVTGKKSAREIARAKAKAEKEARLKAEAEAKAQREAEIAAQEKAMQQADALVKAGKPGEAYDLLEPMEFERSGEVRYDYLLGIAALDSGKPAKATLAFERVLAVDPNFAGARLDMARAYYQLGDLPRAQKEFNTVLKQNPPPAAKATIQKYLAAIDVRMHAKETRITGYLEVTAGHDSNVNTSTSQGQIAVPALGNLTFALSSTSLKAEDFYAGWAGGVRIIHPVNEGVAVFGGVDLRQRGNMAQTQFDTMTLAGTAGGIFSIGRQDSLRLGLVDGQYTLGSVRYYDDTGINAEWRHVFSPANQMSVFGQQMQYRFVDSARFAGMSAQNFDQSVAGTSWLHVMPDGKSTAFGSLFYGQERDVTGTRPDGAKRFYGIRVGGQAAMNEKTEFFANAGWNYGTYSKQNAFFLINRRDVLYDATAGINWHWDKLWTVRPQLTMTHNQSNIAIYSYDRTDISVTLRRDFN